MNNYIVAVPDAGVVAVRLFVVPVLRLDIALGADTGGGGGRGLITGGVVTGGGSGHVTGGRRGRGGPVTGGRRGRGGPVTGGRRGRGGPVTGGRRGRGGPVTGGGRGAGDALLSLDSTALSPVSTVLSQGILK